MTHETGPSPFFSPYCLERAAAEMQYGRPVFLSGPGGGYLVLAAGTMQAHDLLSCSGGGILLSSARLAALGRQEDAGDGSVLLSLPEGEKSGILDSIRCLADPCHVSPRDPVREIAALSRLPVDREVAGAVMRLVRIAHLLPAACLFPGGEALARARDWLCFSPADILRAAAPGQGLAGRVLSLSLPVAGAEGAQLFSFPFPGGQLHHALVIGTVQAGETALVRIHSSCFTGDVLGSLRCDCGPQLDAALSAMIADGSGILLYLSQEGRGIGLAAKLRAYQLQACGQDSVEANLRLGFGDDERSFAPAGVMLRYLGHDSIRLMTNNPAKLSGLEEAGIRVVRRVPLLVSPNHHNRRYLETKAGRLRHLFP